VATLAAVAVLAMSRSLVKSDADTWPGGRAGYALLTALAWLPLSVSGSPLSWFRHRFDGCFSLPAVASSSASATALVLAADPDPG